MTTSLFSSNKKRGRYDDEEEERKHKRRPILFRCTRMNKIIIAALICIYYMYLLEEESEVKVKTQTLISIQKLKVQEGQMKFLMINRKRNSCNFISTKGKIRKLEFYALIS